MANVRFYFGTQAKYDALVEKNPIALYFIEDTQRLYKGDTLMATGADASALAAGLMSAADKKKLDALTVDGGISKLVAVDDTIVMANTEDGGKSIGVAISSKEGNTLVAVDGGLFVPTPEKASVPEYTIEKQEVAEEGFVVSYKLKRTLGDEISYVGDTINIAKDMVLQGATLEVVSEANVPYAGAAVGDPYIDMAFNDAAKSHIYIPVNGLVDTYTAGAGIEIVDGEISVKIADEANGLQFVDGAMSISLATATSAGALSAADKAFIDSIPEVFASKKFVNAVCENVKYEISSTPEGTLVNYGEKEIRVMCPADAKFTKQSVGAGGDANSYYMTFKTYAPNDNAVGYIEHLNGRSDSEILTKFSTDQYGRRYQSTWLALAKYDEATGAWTYNGNNSSVNKYIGWDYQIDWYDANGIMIASDNVRINLSNESCHNNSLPSYMNQYATIEQIAKFEEMLTWNEIVEF